LGITNDRCCFCYNMTRHLGVVSPWLMTCTSVGNPQSLLFSWMDFQHQSCRNWKSTITQHLAWVINQLLNVNDLQRVVLRPVRLAYQPPASSTFLSQRISHQQPASNAFLSE
jgi:hypothetical protein